MKAVAARRPLRRELFVLLEPKAWPRAGLSPVNRAIAGLILASAAVTVLESEPLLHEGNEFAFLALESVFATIFLVEYVARLWAAAENPKYGPGLAGRLRYAASPAALLDLVALCPLLFAFAGTEAFLLRLFRLLRILRLAKLGRYSSAFTAISEALRSRRHELVMSLGIASLLLLVSSTLLYLAEGGVQPDVFGSIPRAMWWSVATLTTVGYGDVYPLTALGKVLAGMTAVTGIGLIAMPTGILAAAFSDAMVRRRNAEERSGEERGNDEPAP